MRILIFLLLIFINISSICLAEQKEIIADATYTMSENDTLNDAFDNALSLAKRTAIEQAGVYVESYSQSVNMRLTDDEIRSITSGMVETTIIDKKRTLGPNDSISVYIKVKCLIKLDDVEILKNKINNRNATAQLNQMKDNYDKASAEINKLKLKMAENNIKSIDVIDDASISKSNSYFNNGVDAISSKNYKYAIDLLTKSIYYNKNFSSAYNERGNAYKYLGQYDSSINDYLIAIKMNPDDSIPYFNLANVYLILKQYDNAVEYYNYAIRLNQYYYYAYGNIGYAYRCLGKYDLALKNYNKSIELNPDIAKTYYARGLVFEALKDKISAKNDFKKFLSMDKVDSELILNAKIKIIEMGG